MAWSMDNTLINSFNPVRIYFLRFDSCERKTPHTRPPSINTAMSYLSGD